MTKKVKNADSSVDGKTAVSEPLQDIVDISNDRPDLTQEEWEIVGKATPYIKSLLRPEVRKELDVEFGKKMAEELDKLKVDQKRIIDEQFAALKKSQEPMDEEEIKKLLSQEYMEFNVPIKVPSPDDPKQMTVRTFIICELPSAVEERFFKLLRTALVPILREREALVFRLNAASFVEKIQMLLDASEKAFELGSSLVAVSLDPWLKEKYITPEWVRSNLSTKRQAGIIVAQFEANKYRDFFSQGFRTFLRQM